MSKLIAITILLLSQSFCYSFENNPKEFVEVLSLVLSQCKNYHETFEVGIKGRSLSQVRRLQKEISDLDFIMNRSRPVQVKVYNYYESKGVDFNIVISLPNESININNRVLNVVMTKKQVTQGAGLGIEFINNRPILFANSKRLEDLSYAFEDSLTEYMVKIGGNK